jgi:cysteine-rich repeat protein
VLAASVVSCRFDSSAATLAGTASTETSSTSAAASSDSEPGTTGTSVGTDGNGDPTTAGATALDTSGPAPATCGDGNVDAGETCDDGNTNPTDGCLVTCERPRSCAHVLSIVADAYDAAYELHPSPGESLTTWCDMSGEGGGWTLVAKVNPTNMPTDAASEPSGWFGATLAVDQLQSPAFTVNGPLASHGAGRFASLIGPESLARFEVVAADDFDQRVSWYKEIASADGFASWFGSDTTETTVCTDLTMTANCSMGTIAASRGDATWLRGMTLDDYGFDTNYDVHMRLATDGSSEHSGLCSGTFNNDDNAWHDSYADHWGNALLVWLHE